MWVDIYIVFSGKIKINNVWKCSNVRDCSGKAYTTTNDSEGKQLTLNLCSVCWIASFNNDCLFYCRRCLADD